MTAPTLEVIERVTNIIREQRNKKIVINDHHQIELKNEINKYGSQPF